MSTDTTGFTSTLSADELLTLHIEWGQALRDFYQRRAGAHQRDDLFDDFDDFEASADSPFRQLYELVELRAKLKDPREILAFDHLIQDELNAVCASRDLDPPFPELLSDATP